VRTQVVACVQRVCVLGPLEFEFLRKLIENRSGLVLPAGERLRLEGRLHQLARRTGLGSLGALVARLRQPLAEPLIAQVVEAMAVRETWFFRDKAPFDAFAGQVIPQLLDARVSAHRIRVWCAAASTGQEAYSVAMCLGEMAPQLAGRQIEIVATDLSHSALEKASAGIYSQYEVQRGLPARLLVKYFTQEGDAWRISPDLRAMVQFRPFNLLQDFTALGRFDVVFCRNVLGLFDRATKHDILRRIARVMPSDGTLILGAGETGAADRPRPPLASYAVPTAASPRLAVVGG
jgi:chemotaxis protein methyltransferase CheR